MRTTIERNVAGTQPDGNPGGPTWSPVSEDQPCYAWPTEAKISRAARVAAGNTTGVLTNLTVLLPNSTDVTSRDRLGPITDRQGHVRFAGPIDINSVTWRPGYLEVQAVSAL